jgi:ArsR family transcriptional regulator
MARSLAVDSAVVARGFHAFSDSTRLEIVELLRDGERCVCELTDALDATQSRLSFHLKVLREAGLVTDRREGRWVYYTLNADVLATLETYLTDIREGLPTSRTTNGRNVACCD